MRVILAALVMLVGCGVDDEYRVSLESLPTIEVAHGAETIAVVSRAMNLDPATVGQVSWVVGGMHRPSGEPIAGAAIGCDLWIEWWGAWDTSGASKDGPAISYTALAHEIAHCALWLQGDEDASHARSEWWGSGGTVERANAVLIDAGL